MTSADGALHEETEEARTTEVTAAIQWLAVRADGRVLALVGVAILVTVTSDCDLRHKISRRHRVENLVSHDRDPAEVMRGCR
ncbi:hypothetical protein ASG53_11490 [Sanguibacter sp. Leaf3]|nr:hypothetical protein ASG53_11490 [Sanguibacter sp. Leaf3]